MRKKKLGEGGLFMLKILGIGGGGLTPPNRERFPHQDVSESTCHRFALPKVRDQVYRHR